jgi:hypothetical protein
VLLNWNFIPAFFFLCLSYDTKSQKKKTIFAPRGCVAVPIELFLSPFFLTIQMPGTSQGRKIGRRELLMREQLLKEENPRGKRFRSPSPRRRLFPSPQQTQRNWYYAVELACQELGIEKTIIAERGTKLYKTAMRIYGQMPKTAPPPPPPPRKRSRQSKRR